MSEAIKTLDVIDGNVLGAVVKCRTCGGSGDLHRPYRLPDGSFIEVWDGELRKSRRVEVEQPT